MSLQATFLQDLRVMYPSQLDRDEVRVTQAGLLMAAMEMSNSPNSIISDDLMAQARISIGRQLDVPVLQKGIVTIKNARSCTVDCAQTTSGFVTVSFRTIVADICMVPSEYENNEIKYMQDLNRKITDMVERFMVEMEIDLDTALDANKSQVYNSTIVGDKYNLVAGAIQVPVALQDFFFNDIDPINYSDDFYDTSVKMISSPEKMSQINKYINQGSGNDQNTNFQFAGKDFRFSNRITNNALVKSTGYFMPDGSIGVVTRVDPDARMEARSTDGTEWFEEMLPGMPFTVGVKYDSTCSDQSAVERTGLAHLTSTLIEHWQFSFDFAIIVPYNSDLATRPSSIRKVEFVA